MKLFPTLTALLFCTVVFSQEKNNPAGKNVNTYNDSLYNGLKWRCIGPYRGGRSLAVAGVKGDLMNTMRVHAAADYENN